MQPQTFSMRMLRTLRHSPQVIQPRRPRSALRPQRKVRLPPFKKRESLRLMLKWSNKRSNQTVKNRKLSMMSSPKLLRLYKSRSTLILCNATISTHSLLRAFSDSGFQLSTKRTCHWPVRHPWLKKILSRSQLTRNRIMRGPNALLGTITCDQQLHQPLTPMWT